MNHPTLGSLAAVSALRHEERVRKRQKREKPFSVTIPNSIHTNSSYTTTTHNEDDDFLFMIKNSSSLTKKFPNSLLQQILTKRPSDDTQLADWLQLRKNLVFIMLSMLSEVEKERTNYVFYRERYLHLMSVQKKEEEKEKEEGTEEEEEQRLDALVALRRNQRQEDDEVEDVVEDADKDAMVEDDEEDADDLDQDLDLEEEDDCEDMFPTYFDIVDLDEEVHVDHKHHTEEGARRPVASVDQSTPIVFAVQPPTTQRAAAKTSFDIAHNLSVSKVVEKKSTPYFAMCDDFEIDFDTTVVALPAVAPVPRGRTYTHLLQNSVSQRRLHYLVKFLFFKKPYIV